jgi:hypothetical protein
MPVQGFDDPFVWLMAEILLPIVPAGFLYWALPTTAETKGKFYGFSVKFGGAFAGYFAVLVLLMYKGPKPPIPPAPSWEAWELKGQVEYKDSSESPATIQLSLEPPPIIVNPDGTFDVDIMVKPGPLGSPIFPTLLAEAPPVKNCGSRTLDLNKNKMPMGESFVHIERNVADHQITIDPPVTLESMPPYSPSGTPFPQPRAAFVPAHHS